MNIEEQACIVHILYHFHSFLLLKDGNSSGITHTDPYSTVIAAVAEMRKYRTFKLCYEIPAGNKITFPFHGMWTTELIK